MVPRKNNFDLLRFVFAFIVFLVHAHALSGRPELSPLSRWLSSELAVESFFVVSGFLVLMSFENSRSLGDYFSKRIRRVYPAYFVVVAGFALGGVFLSQLRAEEYFSPSWIRYLAANLTFLNFLAPELPGVFPNNAFTAVNGALWTLKIEVIFYLCVPLIALICTRSRRWWVLLALYALSVVYTLAMERLAQQTGRELYVQLGRQLPGQLTFFLAGAAGYYFLDAAKRYWWALAPIAFPVLLAPLPRHLEVALEPAALGIVVVYLATGIRNLGNFGRFGDLSYASHPPSRSCRRS
jgi:peptidoglycan/LPS O-acetylase OafA/YrhL